MRRDGSNKMRYKKGFSYYVYVHIYIYLFI